MIYSLLLSIFTVLSIQNSNASENISNKHCVEKINDNQCLQDYEKSKKIKQLPDIQRNKPIEIEVIPYKQ